MVASANSARGARRRLREKVKVEGHTWLAARCGGPDYFTGLAHHDVWNRGVFAHTSPVYVACGGPWEMFSPEVAQYMLTLVEGGMTYIRESAAHHPPGSVTHHHGEDNHLAYLLRPYMEARELLRRRMQSR